jgi:hypothetical protein
MQVPWIVSGLSSTSARVVAIAVQNPIDLKVFGHSPGVDELI